MASVTFRIDDDTKSEIDTLRERGFNVSAIFRQALGETVEQAHSRGRTFPLTLKERLFLYNQFRILEALLPDNADYFTRQQEALASGYELHYPWMVENFSDGLSREQCGEVLDILEMYDQLQISCTKLGENSGIDANKLVFRGFSGNEESHQMAYTRYFIEDLGRYETLSKDAFDGFNSHIPMLDVYRRMLVEWEKRADRYNLSKDDICRIINAMPWHTSDGNAA